MRLTRRAGVLAAAFLAAVSFGSTALAADFFVGVDEDAVKWGRADLSASIVRSFGLGAIRITVPWRAGTNKLSAADQAVVERAVVGAWGLRIVVSVYGTAVDTPRTDEARAQFCDFVGDLLARNPSLNDVVVWNDPNDATYWQPQFNADGSSAAPADYEALLARCWDTLHALRPTVNVVGVAASTLGVTKNAHDISLWYRRLGDAYRASGRTLPVMDTFGHVPHGASSSERPWATHPRSTVVSQGDYGKLVTAITTGFRSTPHPLPGQLPVSIWYLGAGFQTAADPSKARLYSGRETDRGALPAYSTGVDRRTGPARDQASQLSDALRVAYCQAKVGAIFNFHLADEPGLAGWQSGILWADWTPKPSYAAFRRAVSDVNNRNLNCTQFRKGVPPKPPVVAATVALSLSHLRVVSAGANAATVSWQTTTPANARVAYGFPASGQTAWATVRGSGTTRTAVLSGLTFATTYRAWVTVSSEDGQRDSGWVDVRTTAAPRNTNASVAGGSVVLDGHPFFPLIVWSQCPDTYASILAAGVNLFAENPCGGLTAQLNHLGGRALSAAVAPKEGGNGPGLIGFFHPDEPDGLGLTPAQLPARPAGASSQLAFLTLTNHFYSWAAPLTPQPDYPGFIAKSDVVGFDLYPLQEWCRPERMGDVFGSQQELVKLASPRPTFQWIEVADWSRCPGGATAVTPATIVAESWLAIAGGAKGLGFFPSIWGGAAGRAIAEVTRDVAKLGPALTGPQLPAESDKYPVKVGARVYNEAIYLIAVNSSWEPAQATVRVPGAGTRLWTVLDEGRQVTSTDGAFPDTFAPLGVHVYVAAPPAD
jgi:hypothetical protein